MTRYTVKTACSKTGCPNDFFPDKWGRMEAARKGWFIQKNGQAWCSDHIPDWVEAWRAKRNKE